MRDGAMQHHLDQLNWPVIGLNITVLGWNWSDLWAAMPGPTAIYAFISGTFMVFQMADKLGWLDYFKTRRAIREARAGLAHVEQKARTLQNQNLADVAHEAAAKAEQVLQHPDLKLVTKTKGQ